MERTPLKAGSRSLERGSTFKTRTGTSLSRAAATLARAPISPASPAQRDKVRGLACVACSEHPVDPMHLIPRGMTTVGQDSPLAVVPACRPCHEAYDTGLLDLLPHLEPAWRAELAFAVERVGLITTLRRVTNDRQSV